MRGETPLIHLKCTSMLIFNARLNFLFFFKYVYLQHCSLSLFFFFFVLFYTLYAVSLYLHVRIRVYVCLFMCTYGMSHVFHMYIWEQVRVFMTFISFPSSFGFFFFYFLIIVLSCRRNPVCTSKKLVRSSWFTFNFFSSFYSFVSCYILFFFQVE